MLRRVRQGEILIEYNLIQTNRKSIECRVLPGEIRVFAPERLPLREADAFVCRQAEWILSAREEVRRREQAASQRTEQTLASGVPVEGALCPVVWNPVGRPQVRLQDSRLLVTGTDGSPEQLAPLIKALLIRLARVRFTEACAHFAPLIGCTPGRITLREQKTKWGSCSAKGNLNFNWRLIMAPPGALHYIVVHELCHMKKFDHSPEFWALVRRYCPDADRWILFLKKDFHPPLL